MNRLLSVLIVFVCFFFASCQKEQKAAVAKKESGPLKVRSAEARERVIKRNVESVGTLFAFDETIISAEIDGKVDEVKADLGDNVAKGQILVKISDEEQRYLLAQNEAQLRSSLERLGLTKDTDRVQDVRQTPDVRRAQADLDDAEQRFKRTRELRDQGIGAQADLDQAQSRFNSAKANYDATINQTRNLIQEVERFKAVVDLQRKSCATPTSTPPSPPASKSARSPWASSSAPIRPCLRSSRRIPSACASTFPSASPLHQGGLDRRHRSRSL